MTRINYETKTDRELLVIVTKTLNDVSSQLKILNGTVKNHNARIAVVEERADKLEDQAKDNRRLLNKTFIGAMSGMGTAIIVLLTRGIW